MILPGRSRRPAIRSPVTGPSPPAPRAPGSSPGPGPEPLDVRAHVQDAEGREPVEPRVDRDRAQVPREHGEPRAPQLPPRDPVAGEAPRGGAGRGGGHRAPGDP